MTEPRACVIVVADLDLQELLRLGTYHPGDGDEVAERGGADDGDDDGAAGAILSDQSVP